MVHSRLAGCRAEIHLGHDETVGRHGVDPKEHLPARTSGRQGDDQQSGRDSNCV